MSEDFWQKRSREAKADARQAIQPIAGSNLNAFREALRLGHMDPTATFADLTEIEQRAVIRLAFYALLCV